MKRNLCSAAAITIGTLGLLALLPGITSANLGSEAASSEQPRTKPATAVQPDSRPVSPRRVIRLGKSQAQQYMRIGVARKFGSLFTNGHNKRIKCRHRIRIGAVRCKTIRWAIGDFEFDGRGVIWITYENGIAWWNYAFRIRQTSTYCVEQGLPKCSSVIVVR